MKDTLFEFVLPICVILFTVIMVMYSIPFLVDSSDKSKYEFCVKSLNEPKFCWEQVYGKR